MGRNLEAGVFQRLDQETAHVVCGFGVEDIGHGFADFGYSGSICLLSQTDSKFRVKAERARSGRAYISLWTGARPKSIGSDARNSVGLLRGVPATSRLFRLAEWL